jgi:hypothetical protein
MSDLHDTCAGPYPAVAAVLSTLIFSDSDVLCFTQVEIKNITGMDRQSTVGLSAVTFNTTSNSNGSFVMTLSSNFASQPQAGDYLKLESPFAGVADGIYQVTASTASSVTCAYRVGDPRIMASASSRMVIGNAVPSFFTSASAPLTVSTPSAMAFAIVSV